MEETRDWQLQIKPDAVMRRLEKAARASRYRVVDRTADSLTLEQGSKAIARFLGEWFVPLGWLPKTAMVTLQLSNGDTSVTCRVNDRRWHVGFFDSRSKDRYRAALRRLLDELEAQSIAPEA